MTGEITLRGRVLPIGGLKEKLLAALRGGIKTVLIPEENAKDLAEIPDNVKSGLEIIPVARMGEVLKHALVREPEPTEWTEPEQDSAKPAGGRGRRGGRHGCALITRRGKRKVARRGRPFFVANPAIPGFAVGLRPPAR